MFSEMWNGIKSVFNGSSDDNLQKKEPQPPQYQPPPPQLQSPPHQQILLQQLPLQVQQQQLQQLQQHQEENENNNYPIYNEKPEELTIVTFYQNKSPLYNYNIKYYIENGISDIDMLDKFKKVYICLFILIVFISIM